MFHVMDGRTFGLLHLIRDAMLRSTHSPHWRQFTLCRRLAAASLPDRMSCKLNAYLRASGRCVRTLRCGLLADAVLAADVRHALRTCSFDVAYLLL